jgi:hypothetical protein
MASEKQQQLRDIAEIIGNAIDRNLKPNEWGQIGRMIKTCGFDLTKDAAEKFANAKLPIEEKGKCIFPYMYGCMKKSNITSNKEDLFKGIFGDDKDL